MFHALKLFIHLCADVFMGLFFHWYMFWAAQLNLVFNDFQSSSNGLPIGEVHQRAVRRGARLHLKPCSAPFNRRLQCERGMEDPK